MKLICVPLDNDAMKRLDFDENLPGDLMEIIITEQVYSELERCNFFAQINKLADANIDSFEDDCITDQEALKTVIESSFFKKLVCNSSTISVVTQIEKMFIEAINRGTGVFFYF